MKFRFLIILFLIGFSININAQTFYDVELIEKKVKIHESVDGNYYIIKLKSTDPKQISNENQSAILECWVELILNKPQQLKNKYYTKVIHKFIIKQFDSYALLKVVGYDSKGFVVSNEEYEKKFEEPIPGAISEIIMYQATLNYEKSIFLKQIGK